MVFVFSTKHWIMYTYSPTTIHTNYQAIYYYAGTDLFACTENNIALKLNVRLLVLVFLNACPKRFCFYHTFHYLRICLVFLKKHHILLLVPTTSFPTSQQLSVQDMQWNSNVLFPSPSNTNSRICCPCVSTTYKYY